MKTVFTEISTVNEIASLEAGIAKKTARLKVLKSHLKVNHGNTCDVLGTEHVVQIRTATRSIVDTSALKAKVSRQFLLAHTSQKEVTSLSTKALTKINLEEAA
tara:strand:- start:2112 stop:2420 length:309 start_codon:yes stop_codon:yes gene_type:complete